MVKQPETASPHPTCALFELCHCLWRDIEITEIFFYFRGKQPLEFRLKNNPVFHAVKVCLNLYGHFRLARKHHAHIRMVENFTEQLNLAELSIVNQFVRFINNQ